MKLHTFLRRSALVLALGACHTLALAVDTPIYTIQGTGSSSPLVGQSVTTTGVVTKINNNGFFLQDLTGDGNPLTSDGIFVFTSTAPTVAVGQYLRLTGNVAEFNTGAATNADTAAHTVTELTGATAITVLGTGYVIAPTVVTLPELVNDDLERYEGMLVTLNGPLTVAQNFFQGRYGQLTLAIGGRLETPTNRFRPGPQAQALADENARRRIILDDGTSTQNVNPTPYLQLGGLGRAGDAIVSLTGVIDYGLATASNAGFGDYKIHPTAPPVFASVNPRTTTPPQVGGNVKLASFNVLNFFTTFTNGATVFGQTGQGCTLGTSTAASLCRGANNLTEFVRQRTKIVEALAAIDADAVGLMEIQNNAVAAQHLVDTLNARVGAGTYAVVPDPAAGTGTDAIKVAMIYKPARLSPVLASVSDVSPINNRPTLAQSFALANGERFSLLVNHLKSKGSCPAASDPDAAGNLDSGDGQGCWNAQRVQQAQQLRSFVATVQTASGSNDVVLVGDFNAYAKEDPIFDLTSNGYVDQIDAFNALGYSYVFDGASGRLDHAISSTPMAPKVAAATHWHINADEAVVYDYNLEFKAPATVQTASGSNDVVLVGDFNAYAKEDPIFDLTSNGYVDQIDAFNALGYSYVFDGASGRLDHAISSTPMAPKVAAATHWHINADEAVVYDYNLEFKAPATTCGGLCPPDPYQPDPYRASDHDPVIVGLNIYKTLRGTSGRDTLVGTPGDDILIGGSGADVLTGGGGNNLFVYQSCRDAGDTITDFVPGKDKLDLRSLLAGLGWTGTDPVAEAWVRFSAARSGAILEIDVDGSGAAPYRAFITLAGLSPAAIVPARDLIVR